jgi:S1-C subfamily serine protease
MLTAPRSRRNTSRLTAFFAVLAFAAPPASAAPAPAPAPCAIALPQLYERVSPAVVSITAAAINPYDPSRPIDRRSGSGVLVDANGLILTNAHVVAGGQPLITVTLDDGQSIPAQVIGADTIFDIAFLRIQPPAGAPLPVARLGDSDAVRVGDEVYAIGNPFGLEQTLTRGIVSAVNRVLPGATWSMKEPLIQTDAAINPGNSGGPLVNVCGDVVGITTAILPDAQSIGFAVPASLIRSVTTDLLGKGYVVRPWLGVQGTFISRDMRDLLKEPLGEGLLIEVVEPSSPAARAGLRGGDLDLVIAGHPMLVGGDVIRSIDGMRVDSPAAAAKALADLSVGAHVAIKLSHGGEERTLELVVEERPASHPDAMETLLGAFATGVSRPPRAGSRFAAGGRLAF